MYLGVLVSYIKVPSKESKLSIALLILDKYAAYQSYKTFNSPELSEM